MLEKLARLRPVLAKQGSVREKRVPYGSGTVYVVRYREPSGSDPSRRVHRSVQIGQDPELAERARRLIAEWRAALQAEKLKLAELDLMTSIVAESRRYTRNGTRRWKRWARQQVADPPMGQIRMMLYDQCYEQHVAQGRPGGRARKSGLW